MRLYIGDFIYGGLNTVYVVKKKPKTKLSLTRWPTDLKENVGKKCSC